MKWFVYGSDCNISQTRLKEILNKYIVRGDTIVALHRPGVNNQLRDYCAINNINLHYYEDMYQVGIEYCIKKADKCLFICSLNEPPALNKGLQMALIMDVPQSNIKCDFV